MKIINNILEDIKQCAFFSSNTNNNNSILRIEEHRKLINENKKSYIIKGEHVRKKKTMIKDLLRIV